MLAAMDEAVGQIVAAVEKAGDAARTRCSSSPATTAARTRAWSPTTARSAAGKGTLYEGGVRVAAFATWDGQIKAGHRSSTQPLHMVDWYPTLLKLAGATLEQKLPLDGRDAWPTHRRRASRRRTTRSCSTRRPNGGAIRVGDWKLVVNNGRQNGDDPAPKKKAGPRDGRAVQPGGRPVREDEPRRQAPGEGEGAAGPLRESTRSRRSPPKAKPKPEDFQVPKVWGEGSERRRVGQVS